MPINLPPGLPIIPDGEVPFSQRIFGVRPTVARAADIEAAGTVAGNSAAGGTEAGGGEAGGGEAGGGEADGGEAGGAEAGGAEAGGAAPFEMSPEDFEAAVSDALLLIPDKAARAMDNVAIFIEDDYTPQPGDDPGMVLLGLYEGVPLTERGSWWDAGSLPDRITIFRQPILDICSSRQDVIDEVAITVIHEIAHHFGIGDDRLHELGWG